MLRVMWILNKELGILLVFLDSEILNYIDIICVLMFIEFNNIKKGTD